MWIKGKIRSCGFFVFSDIISPAGSYDPAGHSLT